MRRTYCIAVTIGLLVVGCSATYLYVQASRTSKMATTVSRLGEIRGRLLQYRQDHGVFPDGGLADLGLRSQDVQDPFTGESFRYQPDPEDETKTTIVEQFLTFRTKLWPFGEVRRYALYANGDIRDVLKESD